MWRIAISLFVVAGLGIIPFLPGAPKVAARPEGPEPVRFNRDIRPILSENCFACHGPDSGKRKAGLRLDRQEVAFAVLESGERAVVPGKPEESALWKRIAAEDPSDRMPPTKGVKKLDREQIETLRRWIQEGAKWEPQWAFLPVARPEPPPVEDASWIRTPPDAFILARLEKEKLRPSAEADRTTLLRRLSFDLTGLPPEPGEMEAFAADADPRACEKQVDRLLDSPHYGERMAIFWLDLVRFGESRGYHSDNSRNVSPYRDYVIRAFNSNMPFDRFTTEQLAGDLLPDANLWSRVASCYNKLNLTTEEGGAQPKEYEAKTAADRVRAISGVWLGATMGCAECHDHKFDPWTAKDFYAMAAFFADVSEKAINDPDGGIPVPIDPEKEVETGRLGEEIARAKTALEASSPELEAVEEEWEKQGVEVRSPALGTWHDIGTFGTGNAAGVFDEPFPPEQEIDLAKTYQDGKVKWTAHPEWEDGKVHDKLRGRNAARYFYRTIDMPAAGPLTLSLGSNDGIKLWVDGRLLLSKYVIREAQPDQERVTVALEAGSHALLMKIHNSEGDTGFCFKVVEIPQEVGEALSVPRPHRSPAQKQVVSSYYRAFAPILEPARKELARLEAARLAILNTCPKCIVSEPGEPRTVRILPRGDWMNESGEEVRPAIPVSLGTLETGARRATRLDLARWLVDPRNPLTARAFVNRLWKLFFGMGLSKRLDDLGAQGEAPVHPELLDWLASEFVRSGWDIKHMVRLLVTSSAYRQTSVCSRELRHKDPENRLAARQSRWRLDAELVRDNALAVSGLLSRKIGGPSVRPYQPPGYWKHVNFPKREWENSKGQDQHRRGLYTWWQRTFPHPSFVSFDAPCREECTAERPRSNIPQQALVLLNDPTYVEAARVLAEKALRTGGASFDERLSWAYRQVLTRAPSADETKVLRGLFEKHLKEYSSDKDGAEKLLGTGQTQAPKDLEAVELAAWVSVTRALLNLHETITRN